MSISNSPAETEALGEAWGRAAQHGLVIALCGELGAGKTLLVRGIARGLDIPVRVHSPTFTLLNIYPGGRLTLFHLDLYRLQTREEISVAGLEDYFKPDGVAVIEWADRWFGPLDLPDGTSRHESKGKNGRTSKTELENLPLPTRCRWVQIEALTETQRSIAYEDFSA
jgi:tRNA threonylcarbamoyladenosine biosynthesis protein TsaE